jgi:lysyl-tRNA synthetase class 2
VLTLERLYLRAAFFHSIRSFFHSQGFIEVDTPIRQPVIIPEANIVAMESDGQFLQSSPELCMKRLLASGCDKIFQICPCFRKGECGSLHHEEFQMLEWYRNGVDYQALMTDCEDLLRFVSRTLGLFKGIELSKKWQRITVAEAFTSYSPISVEEAVATDSFDEILVEHIEPQLGIRAPVFLCDYPLALGSLAREKQQSPGVVERFELYLAGVELANGFSELTDEAEQRKRFTTELEIIVASRGLEMGLPERFLKDIKKIDSAAGIALGLDRLLMLAAGCTSLEDVVSFSPGDFL